MNAITAKDYWVPVIVNALRGKTDLFTDYQGNREEHWIERIADAITTKGIGFEPLQVTVKVMGLRYANFDYAKEMNTLCRIAWEAVKKELQNENDDR